MYINVNSIKLHSNEKDEKPNEDLNNLEFSEKDMEFFKELSQISDENKNPFKLIVNSLCPGIFGHELVKAGLVLGLFGGSKNDNMNDLTVRNDIHVLVVGDPGLGKVN